MSGPAPSGTAPEPAAPHDAGHTMASQQPPSWAAPSVHDQQTVTSMPSTDVPPTPRDAVPSASPWTHPSAGPGMTAPPQGSASNPFAPEGSVSATPHGSPTNPFAPPGSVSATPHGSPTNPFAPEGATSATPHGSPTNPFAPPGPVSATPHGSPSNPFAPPGPMPATAHGSPANPFAPPVAPGPYVAHGEPVPPPPIGPEGPGQIPYGYPGGQGYPPGPPNAGGYYGWPGLQPLPNNGMGTAGLVLGIISAVIFCLWPVAIVVGILALIFGTIGRVKASRGEATNPGQALAGIICGAAGVVLGLGMLALVISTAL
ncbi:hypothetical protein ACWCPI_22760 [Streptomyces sp. NPDC001920]